MTIDYKIEAERFQKALVKYGHHLTGCHNKKNVGECTCGLWEALSLDPPTTEPYPVPEQQTASNKCGGFAI